MERVYIPKDVFNETTERAMRSAMRRRREDRSRHAAFTPSVVDPIEPAKRIGQHEGPTAALPATATNVLENLKAGNTESTAQGRASRPHSQRANLGTEGTTNPQSGAAESQAQRSRSPRFTNMTPDTPIWSTHTTQAPTPQIPWLPTPQVGQTQSALDLRIQEFRDAQLASQIQEQYDRGEPTAEDAQPSISNSEPTTSDTDPETQALISAMVAADVVEREEAQSADIW